MQSSGFTKNANRWAKANAPDAIIRRRAAADAKREALAAELPPLPAEPEPLSMWQTVLVLDAHGGVMHRIELRVPTRGTRCDQHAAEVDGVRRLMNATQVGLAVAGMIAKRPSFEARASAQSLQLQHTDRTAELGAPARPPA